MNQNKNICHPQKAHSNRTLCWCQRGASSITSTMHHVAGHSFDGIRLALRLARNATCRCAASLCCCHAASRCSQASSLSAVRSTLKVSPRPVMVIFCAIITLVWLAVCQMTGRWHENRIIGTCNEAREGKKSYHSIYFLSRSSARVKRYCQNLL